MKEFPKIIYQSLRNPFIKFCVKHKITSNQTTLFNHFITLTAGCYFFSRGTYGGLITGFAVCLVNGFLDYLDGDLARETNQAGKLGAWLDSGFDVIIQNAVMGAIAIGCYKMGLPLIWVIMFFISNAANNFVSFNYNATFGFSSEGGNELFRNLMDQKRNPVNIFLKSIIDPTCGYVPLVLLTFRYWITLGAILNIMPFCFIVMTIIGNIKWIIMYTIYAMHLREDKYLHVLKTLSALDEERNEYFRLQYSGRI